LYVEIFLCLEAGDQSQNGNDNFKKAFYTQKIKVSMLNDEKFSYLSCKSWYYDEIMGSKTDLVVFVPSKATKTLVQSTGLKLQVKN